MSECHIDLTPEACRAARALLQWGVRDVAEKAGIGFDTISHFERGRPMRASNRQLLADLFAEHGVELLGDGRPGARLR